MTVLWIGQGHAGQGELIRLIRAGLGPGATVVAPMAEDREDPLSTADIAMRERSTPDPSLRGQAYADWLLAAGQAIGATAMLVHRGRRDAVSARSAFEAAGIRLSGGALHVEDLDATQRKDVFTRILEEHGVPVPQTIAVHDGPELRRAVSAVAARRDACVKPAVGIYGRGFWRLSDSAREVDAFLNPDDRVASADAFMRAYDDAGAAEPYLVMEWLPGPEWSVDCVCDAGRIVAAASRRKEHAWQVVETRGPQVELARRVAGIFGLDGVVNVQVRLDAEGVMRVLEANTRPSGGLTYSAAAGVNLPGIWARHATGLPVTVPRLAAPAAVRTVTRAVMLEETTRHLLRGQAA